MNLSEQFLNIGEFGAAGAFEEPERSLFYRKALGLRRFYENCELAPYNGELLYPSGVQPFNGALNPHYMFGFGVNYSAVTDENRELVNKYLEVFDKYKTTVPAEHSVAGNMYMHSMPNYERILKEGLSSYIPRIEKISDVDMRDGLLHLVKGIEAYINRCVSFLESAGANSVLINALKKVPMFPAENIYEAVIALNFILYLDNCDNLGPLASVLLPYYKGENIVEYLKNLYDNLDVCCGYSMSLHTDYNPLTLQCLEASKGKRRPMIELFVDKNTPDEIWQKAFEVIRSTNGQPAFYNPEALLGGLKSKFPEISADNLKKFCGGGCTEAMIAGLSSVGSLDAGINLLLILEQTIYSSLKFCRSFEEFYKSYINNVQAVVDTVTREISNSQKNRALYNPLPMRTLLIDDCIDKGLDYNNGGARYRWSIINFAGMINVIDSLLVIRDFIFEDKALTADELINGLKTVDKEFLNKAKGHKIAFGTDNDDANTFSNRLSTEIFAMLDDKVPYSGGGFIPASIQFQSQADAGKNIGATPDGREAGAPLCDSLAAIFGKDVKGPTAL